MRLPNLVVALMLVSILGLTQAVTPDKASQLTASSALTTTDYLRLRSGPSLDDQILLVMPPGVSVAPTGNASGVWLEVDFSGVTGWAHSDWLTANATTEQVNVSSVAGDIESIIAAAAQRYGQSPAAMISVAQCESRLDPSAFNGNSGASGLFQFLPSTWASTPYASQSIWDPYASANAAAWMWSVGRRGEWVC
jgi:uncharacterized protein YraI